MRVILIGAGISSAIISLLLRRQFGHGIKLIVFDKGKLCFLQKRKIHRLEEKYFSSKRNSLLKNIFLHSKF